MLHPAQMAQALMGMGMGQLGPQNTQALPGGLPPIGAGPQPQLQPQAVQPQAGVAPPQVVQPLPYGQMPPQPDAGPQAEELLRYMRMITGGATPQSEANRSPY